MQLHGLQTELNKCASNHIYETENHATEEASHVLQEKSIKRWLVQYQEMNQFCNFYLCLFLGGERVQRNNSRNSDRLSLQGDLSTDCNFKIAFADSDRIRKREYQLVLSELTPVNRSQNCGTTKARITLVNRIESVPSLRL